MPRVRLTLQPVAKLVRKPKFCPVRAEWLSSSATKPQSHKGFCQHINFSNALESPHLELWSWIKSLSSISNTNSLYRWSFQAMDPLSALSLAGTIVQFVDFGSKLLSESSQLYKSSLGKLEAHEELELVTGDLQCVIVKLRETFNLVSGEPCGPLQQNDQFQEDSFHKICEEALEIADELLNRLKRLKVKDGKYRAWESLKAAVKIAWSKEEISSLRQRLSIFRESLHSRLMLSMKYSIIYAYSTSRAY